MNAFDDDGAVVVDLVRYPKMFATHLIGPEEGTPVLERWRIDPAAGKVVTEVVDDQPQEFPRVDERVVGRPHRYGYALRVAEGDPDRGRGFAIEGALLKHDRQRGTVEATTMGGVAGEAVFIPSGQDAAEDDGYVMSLVFNPETETSDLVVLAAQDFTAEPVARVHLPVRVPVGFHGNWIADTAP
jgi:carotenoid cleavage dioxygenase